MSHITAFFSMLLFRLYGWLVLGTTGLVLTSALSCLLSGLVAYTICNLINWMSSALPTWLLHWLIDTVAYWTIGWFTT